CSSRIRRSPFRSTLWSSANRILMRLSQCGLSRVRFRFDGVPQRDGDENPRARPRRRFQIQSAAHLRYPLFDADQPEAAFPAGGCESLAVVFDPHDVAVLLRSQSDVDRSSFGVPGAVGEGLLYDSVQARLLRVREAIGAAVIVQADPNRGAGGELF